MLPVKLFTDFIKQNNLFDRNEPVLAAVSGGMDSVLMAHLLKAAGFNVGIAHCNFQLRGAESVRDQTFCARLAEKLDAPFFTNAFDTSDYAETEKISTQMAARRLRYQWFEQIRVQSGYRVIALAHHQNDAIETILFNLVRGTGIAGLHGILPKNGVLVRPLLFLKRDEILNIINENELDFVEDSSNTSVKYARNKIRLEVIPKLKELNPALEQTFKNNLDHFTNLEILLNLRVAELKQELFINFGDEIHINTEKLKQLEPKNLLLFNLFKEFGFNETVIDDLVKALHKHSGRRFESPAFNMVSDRDKLIISKKTTVSLAPVIISPENHRVHFGNYILTVLHDDSPLIVKNNVMGLSVDRDMLVYPLTLRAWKSGDFFYPTGMKNRKKLSDFFINQKVPLPSKNEIPILVNGNSEIIWVGGLRPDERYKVTNNTKKVTIFELTKI